ncbi:MAG: pilin, partial [Patescibacteria group bacterium]
MRFFKQLFTKKIIIAILAVGLGLLAIGPVLVARAAPADTDNGLDWQWPTVPGVGSLAQKSDATIVKSCQQSFPSDLDKQRKCVGDEKGKLLGLAVRYFLYLFFYLITGVCVILIILAGVSYVMASGRVQKLLDAKTRLRNAAWGLLIIASSWALLYIINPNLLLFQTKIPDIPPIPVIEGEKNGSNVTFASFSVKEMIDYVIASSTAEDPKTGEMKILSPYHRAQNALDEALLILQGDPSFDDKIPPRPGLKKLLEFCQCGQSKFHIERVGNVDMQVKGGETGEEIIADLKAISDSGRKPDTQDVCLTRCENCGSLPGQPVSGDKYADHPCRLNNVLTVSTKKDPANATKVVPLKCPYPLVDTDYKKIWELGRSLTPLFNGVIPAQWQEENEFWEKCQFIYYDRNPLVTTNKFWKDWAVLAVFYPEYTDRKWIEFTNDKLGSDITAEYGNYDNYLAYSIKYHITRLFKIVPQLQAIKLELASDQIEKLGKVLASNAMDYLLFEGNGGIFQPEIDDEKRMLAERGYDVNVQEFMGNEEIPGLNTTANPPATTALGKTFWGRFKILAALSDFVQPFQKALAAQPVLVKPTTEPSDDRFYVVTNVESFGGNISPYDERMVKQNKLVLREASRANLFAVLAGQTLEEIEKMTGDCMASAFGEAKYDLPANINEVIKSAINQGTADYLVNQFAKNSDQFAGLIGQEIADQVSQKAEGTLKKRCANKCNNLSLDAPLLSDEAMKAYLDNPANKECVEKCEKENIPADFVSNAIGQFLSQPVVLQLPGEIGKDLGLKLKEVLKESDVVAALDDDMIKLYNKVLQGGLSKSFADQIPVLKKTLDTNIYVYLVQNLSSGVLSNINSFLNFRVNEYLKRKIHDEAEKVAGGLTNEFDQLVEKGVDALKETMPNLFPEGITDPAECSTLEMLQKGYRWQGTKGCQKMTIEDINTFIGAPCNSETCGFSLDIDGQTLLPRDICHYAGYIWSQYWEVNNIWKGMEKGDWACGEDQWITTDLKGLTDVKALGQKVLAGAINFVEEFAVALTATIMHTTLAYTDVWVEDEVLGPLGNYISQFSGLQESLKKFLHTSVNDLLPEQISQTLNSNVDKVLKDICAKAPPEPDNPTPEQKGEKQTFTISLYGEKTYGGSIPIDGALTTNENLWRVCDASRHLHTTLAKEISSSGDTGDEIIGIFNTKVVDLIPWDGAKDLLKMTPTQLIFKATGLEGIDT